MNDLHTTPFLNDEVAALPPVGGRGRKWMYLAGLAVAGVLLLFLSYGWADRPVWKEGDVRVYGKNGQYTLMVRGDGYSMDLLDEQVVEIGSNDRWLVVRQWRDNVSRYYALKKPLGILSPFDFEKPLSQESFDRLKVKDDLPPFTWHNRWVDYPAPGEEEAVGKSMVR